MAVETEVLRLLYQLEGEQAIKRAQAELERLEAVAEATAQGLRAAGATEQQFVAGTAQIAKQVGDARAKLGALNEVARQSTTGTKDLGLAALEAGRGLEDLATGGLLGVLNNVPQLIQALGGPAGLVGVIGAVGAATYTLYRNWDTLKDFFELGIERPAIRGLEGLRAKLSDVEEQIGKLREKSRLSFAELQELGELEFEKATQEAAIEQEETIAGLFERQSARQKAVADAFAKAISEADLSREDFGDAITAALERSGHTTAQAVEVARKLTDEAAKGSAQARDEILRALDRQGSEFGRQIARQIREAAPEFEALDRARKAYREAGAAGVEAAERRAEAAERASETEIEAARRTLRESEEAYRDASTAAAEAYGKASDAARGGNLQMAQDAAEAAEEAGRRAEEAADRIADAEEEVQAAIRKTAEEERKKAEAAEDAARRQIEAQAEVIEQMRRAVLDPATKRVVEAFGPALGGRIQEALRGRIAGGQDTGTAFAGVGRDVAGFLQRAGVEAGVAAEATRQLVGEQAQGFQAMLDAFEAQRQLNIDGVRNFVLMRRWLGGFQQQARQMAIIGHNNAGRW